MEIESGCHPVVFFGDWWLVVAMEVLLMVQKSGDHHLTWMKPVINGMFTIGLPEIFTISTGDCLVNNGINYLPYQLVIAGFLNHQQSVLIGALELVVCQVVAWTPEIPLNFCISFGEVQFKRKTSLFCQRLYLVRYQEMISTKVEVQLGDVKGVFNLEPVGMMQNDERFSLF